MTDEFGGTSCQIDQVAMSALSHDEEKMLREEVKRLTYENCQLKEKLTNKDITLESIRHDEDTVWYFTGLADFVSLAAIFNFVSTHLPFEKRRALSPHQALILTFMHIREKPPLQHLASPRAHLHVVGMLRFVSLT